MIFYLNYIPLNRDDEACQAVSAVAVATLLEQNTTAAEVAKSGEGSSEEEEDEDDTCAEYWSEEEVDPVEVDSDDE
jgi:hypothetical protein